MNSGTVYDVIIVGAGVSGALIAYKLASEGKKVLILEAGKGVPDNRSEYMKSFYLARAKTPESAYPTTEPAAPAPLFPLQDPKTLAAPRATILQLTQWRDPKQSYLVQPQTPRTPTTDATGSVRKMPFASTYERVGGGTTWHWLGTSLRHVPHDLTMYSTYGKDVPSSPFSGPWADWPISYPELQELYGKAEEEIGVAASVQEQAPLREAIGLTYPEGYAYPMQSIPMSLVDQAVSAGLGKLTVSSGVPQDPKRYDVFVTPTPAGRNSQPYQNRRVCAGNTNCIPICPIQAKWDATVTLNNALDTGYVDVIYNAVACNVALDANGSVSGIDYLVYASPSSPQPSLPQPFTARGKAYVLAAHAIENAKLLLMSNGGKGVANSSDQVGRNLMDHLLYLTWALAPEGKPVFGYRGPLATSGIESLRDGEFRKHRSAFRIEIGNEGWSFSSGDPYTTVNDFVLGTNVSQLNPDHERLGGPALALKLNDLLTRQFRMAFEMEQSPQAANRVVLDYDNLDGLGLPRPKIIDYGLDEYTLNGFRAARVLASEFYKKMGAQEFTQFGPPKDNHNTPGYFMLDDKPCRYFGAGHIVGTHRMGTDKDHAVVNASQRSFDHQNLWVVGSGSFPTVATANPTLTLMALAFKSAADILTTL